tara:strand:+ start:575 stop:1162 length:588 start_codon:yes stop_codon:yes gene_type:complete
MIHQCNVCQRNKLYFQTNDYCSECKVFICSGCLETWEKDNNKCPICHKITEEDTEQIRFIEQTNYDSEEENTKKFFECNCNCNYSLYCCKRNTIHSETENENEKYFFRIMKNISPCFKVIFFILIMGFIMDICIYIITNCNLETNEEKQKYKEKFIEFHKNPVYYIFYPLYSLLLSMIVFIGYLVFQKIYYTCKY